MNDWLNPLFEPSDVRTAFVVLVRLLSAAFFGAVVSAIYFWSISRRKPDVLPFGVTLNLLSILVAMTTLIIGNNQALAFSLVGTLAIVRFRTTMDDTRDTAFVIFAVTVGMGSAVGALMVVLIGIPIIAFVVFLATGIARRIPQSGPERIVAVRMTTVNADPAILNAAISRHTLRQQLMGLENVKSGETIEYQYLVKFSSPNWLAAVTDWKTIPGVLSVEVKGKV